jgi:hypothetical protein
MTRPSAAAVAALELAEGAKRHSPDWVARGGLTLLGAYCLWGAVDHTYGGAAAVALAALLRLLP